MKKRTKQHGNQERWMVSYADFMTLLFAFFVVLYSSSRVDKARMASLSNAITAGFQELGVGAGSGGARVVIPGTHACSLRFRLRNPPRARRPFATNLRAASRRISIQYRVSPRNSRGSHPQPSRGRIFR